MKIFNVKRVGTDPTTGAVTIAAGSYRLIKVAHAYECRLGSIVVRQVPAGEGGGTSVAYTVDYLKAKLGIAVDTDIPNATALPSPIDLYKTFTQKAGAAGATVAEYTPAVGSDGYLFRNDDGTQTNPIREGYLLLRPTAAGDATKWEFFFTLLSDIG